VPVGAVVLLSMVGYFAGVVQAPITTFLIVMEMTDNHEMVLPLMATALIATAVSRIVCPHPLYSSLAERFLSHGQPSQGLGKVGGVTTHRNS
ncbi:MAG: chloride channel protein, partial [Nitrosomonadaceae bacterium]